MKIITILDSKADAYLVPMFSATTATAIRMLEAETRNPESNLCKFSEDYIVVEIGEFDEQTGTLIAYDVPLNLGLVAQLKETQNGN